MRDDSRALVLENLPARSVIVVMMTVDQVLDRSFCDLANFFQISLCRLRAAIADRVSDDHAGRRDDEHRLVILIAEDVDVVGAFDFGGCKHRLLRRCLRHCGCGTARTEDSCRKSYESFVHGWYLPDAKPHRTALIPAPKSRT